MSRQWLEKMERIGVDITSGYMGVGDGGGRGGGTGGVRGLGPCLGYLGRWWYPSLLVGL